MSFPTSVSADGGNVDPADRALLRWRNAVFMIFALSGLSFASFLGRLPAVRDELAASTTEVSFLTLGIAAGSVVGLIGSGALAARFGPRKMLTVTLPTLGVAMPLAAAAAEAGWLSLTLAAMVIVGLANGITDVCMNLSGAANERARSATTMPAFHAAFSVGTVLGALGAAAAEAAGVGLAAHIVVVNGTLLVTGLISVRFLPRRDTATAGHERVSRSERRAVWREPRTLGIGLLVFGMALTEGSATDWLALAMVDDHGTSKTVGTLTFAVFVCAMTIGRLLGSVLLRALGRVRTLRACGVLALAGLTLVIFGPTWAAFVGVALWGLGASLGFPVGMSAAADEPRLAAARVSAVSTIGYLAFLAGPPVIGLLGEQVTLLRALLVVLTAVAVSLLVAPAARELDLPPDRGVQRYA